MPPIWISHRGLKYHHSENTRHAFAAAADHGFTHFETDLRFTSDGHLVLLHDDNLKRLGGSAKPVAMTSRQELSTFKLPCGGRVMFFDELMEDFSAFHWTFDIKLETGRDVINCLAQKWYHERASWFKSQVRLLMWSAAQQKLATKELPEVPFYARQSQCLRAGLAILIGIPFLAGIKPGLTYSLTERALGISLFDERYVHTLHRYQARALAFLPATPQAALQAVRAGFDEILTDHLIGG